MPLLLGKQNPAIPIDNIATPIASPNSHSVPKDGIFGQLGADQARDSRPSVDAHSNLCGLLVVGHTHCLGTAQQRLGEKGGERRHTGLPAVRELHITEIQCNKNVFQISPLCAKKAGSVRMGGLIWKDRSRANSFGHPRCAV